jgi:DNA-binding NarL/FixJ family response regulator
MNSVTTSKKIRVMVVEDHVLVRMGLVSAANAEPDLEVVAEAQDGAQAMKVFRKQSVDIVVLDLRLPGADGVEIIKLMRSEFGPVRILVLSSYGGGDDIARAMKAGASGYIVKGMDLEHLLAGIRAIHAGRQYVPPEISSRIIDRHNSEISSREREVLTLIARGLSNREIAAQMGIVEGTVKAHLTNIFTKLGAADRAQALAIAIRRQILQLD